MASADKAPVNLDALGTTAGRVTLFGETHEVRDLDGEDYALLKDGVESVGILRLYELIDKLIPTLSVEQVRKLTVKQVTPILMIADGRVEEVEAAFPNVLGPTESDPPAPVSP